MIEVEETGVYATMVAALAKPGNNILLTLDGDKCHLWHIATGIAGEAGELLDAVKKHVIYNKPLDMANVIEELGDLEFFLEGLRHSLGLTREQCLLANMSKLKVHYDRLVYSDRQAQERKDKQQP